MTNSHDEVAKARAAAEYAMDRLDVARAEAGRAADERSKIRQDLLAVTGERDRLRSELDRVRREGGGHEAEAGRQRQRADLVHQKYEDALRDLDRARHRIQELDQQIAALRGSAV